MKYCYLRHTAVLEAIHRLSKLISVHVGVLVDAHAERCAAMLVALVVAIDSGLVEGIIAPATMFLGSIVLFSVTALLKKKQ